MNFFFFSSFIRSMRNTHKSTNAMNRYRQISHKLNSLQIDRCLGWFCLRKELARQRLIWEKSIVQNPSNSLSNEKREASRKENKRVEELHEWWSLSPLKWIKVWSLKKKLLSFFRIFFSSESLFVDPQILYSRNTCGHFPKVKFGWFFVSIWRVW